MNIQTKLEVKAISKRNELTVQNNTDKYAEDGNQAKKGGDSIGSLFMHNRTPDLMSGGDEEYDVPVRNTQLSYTVRNLTQYSVDNKYNREYIDTSGNEGQIVIY